MLQNEILDEIHQIREEHAKSFNYDLEAMFADWQKKQAQSGRKVVNLSAKHGLKAKRAGDIAGYTEDTSGDSNRTLHGL